MNCPLTEEETWIASFAKIPAWTPPGFRTVLVSPHPDDEVLGAGGLLAAQARAGFEVTVIAVTDGEMAYGSEGADALRRQRNQEQCDALSDLGLAPTCLKRLQLPDTLGSAWEGEIQQKLIPFLDERTLLVSPWVRDRHPDHEACGRAALSAAAATGATHVSYFFWAWHYCRPDEALTSAVFRFELDAALLRRKAKALARYHSQLHRDSGDPILPEKFLAPARRSFEAFLIHDSSN